MSSTELDFDSHYTVDGYRGIAFYLIGYATEWTEESWAYIGGNGDDRCEEESYVYIEPEEIEDRQRVRAVMVGDDRVFEIDVDDLTPIDEDDYCAECGQIGCTADGRERGEDV